MKGDEKFIENEFQWLYIIKLQDDIEIVHDDGELDETMWVAAEDLKDIINGNHEDKIVPHGNAYFDKLFLAIENSQLYQ